MEELGLDPRPPRFLIIRSEWVFVSPVVGHLFISPFITITSDLISLPSRSDDLWVTPRSRRRGWGLGDVGDTELLTPDFHFPVLGPWQEGAG